MFMPEGSQKNKDLKEAETMFKKFTKPQLIDYIATKTKYGIKNCKENGYNYFVKTFKNNSKKDLILHAYTFYRRSI